VIIAEECVVVLVYIAVAILIVSMAYSFIIKLAFYRETSILLFYIIAFLVVICRIANSILSILWDRNPNTGLNM
jgi:hypothetical protein